jgi:hypothetical protein
MKRRKTEPARDKIKIACAYGEWRFVEYHDRSLPFCGGRGRSGLGNQCHARFPTGKRDRALDS